MEISLDCETDNESYFNLILFAKDAFLNLTFF